MEKVDKGKDKEHTDKLTGNPELEDKTPYITFRFDTHLGCGFDRLEVSV